MPFLIISHDEILKYFRFKVIYQPYQRNSNVGWVGKDNFKFDPQTSSNTLQDGAAKKVFLENAQSAFINEGKFLVKQIAFPSSVAPP